MYFGHYRRRHPPPTAAQTRSLPSPRCFWTESPARSVSSSRRRLPC